VGIAKLAAKAKNLNPNDSPPPTLDVTVRYLIAKAAAASRTRVGDYDSAQAPPSKPPRIFGSPPAPASLSTRMAISPAPHEPAPARSTTFSSAELVPLEGVGEPCYRTFAQGFQASSAAVHSKDGGGNNDIFETEDFDDDFDYIRTSGSSGRDGGSAGASAEISQAPSKSSFRDGVTWVSIGGADSGGGVQLSTSDAATLKELLFAGQGGRQPTSWIQGFFFSPHLGLEYGLVQTEGGPCGVLAAVQAHIIKHLVGKTGGHPAGITREQQQDALCKGLAGALWQARGIASIVVVGYCLNGDNWKTTVGIGFDKLLRSVIVYRAVSLDDAERLVAGRLGQWGEPRGQGICMFLLSLLLSRGIAETRGDMDEAESSLLGAHGYCTQDLVNLIIVGRAHSNLFNREMVIGQHTTLRGVPAPSAIGFLTLFEWYQSVEVGSYYKAPMFPVWVLCCESHFTCIFAMDGRAATRGKFPTYLYYYDGLANQDAPMKLTLNWDSAEGHTARRGESMESRNVRKGDLVPPLEYVLETQWPGVVVDWNETEPML